MEESTIWWLLAGGLVVAELLTGTFYLLMLAVGVGAAGIAAHLGASTTAQILTAALVGGGSVVGWHLLRRKRPGDPSARADRSVNLDVGETVQIDGWNADGTAQIRYRGTQWTVLARPGTEPRPGPHRVAELVGSRLLVDPL